MSTLDDYALILIWKSYQFTMRADHENASKFGLYFENLLINDEIMLWIMCYRLVSSCLVSSFVTVSMFLINKIYEHIEKYLFRGHVTVNWHRALRVFPVETRLTVYRRRPVRYSDFLCFWRSKLQICFVRCLSINCLVIFPRSLS